MLVKDIDTAIADWTKILGVLDPRALAEPIVKYDEFEGGADAGMKWATFVANHTTEIQFIQPSPGTPLGKRLEEKGEHVHHLCFTVDDVPGTMAKLDAEGIAVVNGGQTYNDPDMPWQTWSWVSPKSAHGVLIEVAKPYESHGDGRWHSSPGRFAEPAAAE
ncbi:methylmalonyl-CoA epimerase [Sphingomonas populi]|uniref:Methylmalonyl-CoA epimerase n=1 Tax=Sphingomonas populi TaxID=2484750 RepID=A0A4Q6XUP0_9SPHN|nr:methylmalonyl-CoA epimerase [Sphingomonas populi]